jgi:hypothetical protein
MSINVMVTYESQAEVEEDIGTSEACATGLWNRVNNTYHRNERSSIQQRGLSMAIYEISKGDRFSFFAFVSEMHKLT